jgi:integrase
MPWKECSVMDERLRFVARRLASEPMAGPEAQVHCGEPRWDTRMPETTAVSRSTTTPEQIVKLIDSITDPHDLCLMSVGVCCATRTSETLGLQWKSYRGDKLIIQGTAYDGKLFPGKVKTNASWNGVPIPEDIQPIVEAWKQVCPDTSPEALMFPTAGRHRKVRRHAKQFLKWRIHPIADKLGIPRKLVTFQVMRRTVGTDLQKHGTMKDAQQILRREYPNHRQRLYAADTDKRDGSDQLAYSGNSRKPEADSRRKSKCNGLQWAPIEKWGFCKCLKRMAPQVGLEPTTLRLTAGLRNMEWLYFQ